MAQDREGRSVTRLATTILGLWLLAFLWSLPAHAHDSATTIYASITVDRAMVRVRLTLSSLPETPFFEPMKQAARTAPGTYAPLADAIARHVQVLSGGSFCRPGRQFVEPPTPISASISATVDYVCRGPVRELEIINDLFDVIGRDIHMIARVDWNDDTQTFTFEPDLRRFVRSTGVAQERATVGLGITSALIAAAITVLLGLAALGLAMRRRS
jgi:hypothetical protein